MGRKMVMMAKITNEKTRITTYKKRKACLYKKANEFSTLCGVDTCLIMYGSSRAGDEMVMEPELWPKDESKIRDILRKYRDTASSSCTKTYTVQECLEKNNTKVEKSKNAPKYHPWDKKLDKCSLNELYAVFMAVENKIQVATNRNQTFPDSTSWSTDQLGLCGYNQQYVEQQQLFPLPTMEHNGFSFFPFINQMTSNTAEVASFSDVPEPMIANGQNFIYGSYSDGPYGPVVQRTAYMEPIQWGLGNNMFNNVKQFRPSSMVELDEHDVKDMTKFDWGSESKEVSNGQSSVIITEDNLVLDDHQFALLFPVDDDTNNNTNKNPTVSFSWDNLPGIC